MILDIRVTRGSATQKILILDLEVYNEDHVSGMVVDDRSKEPQYHEYNPFDNGARR